MQICGVVKFRIVVQKPTSVTWPASSTLASFQGDLVLSQAGKRLDSQRVGDLVDDVLQHGEPQREHDGIGSLHRAPVVERDERRAADRPGQLRADSWLALESCRASPPAAN